MPSSKPLFTLPITTGGEITLTLPAPNIYLLTFTSPPDNRVTIPYLEAFSLALEVVEHRCPSGSVLITTSGVDKFYSNGFDIADLQTGGTQFMKKVFELIWRILAYPIPIIALVNGHAFGAGVFLAFAHDYRVQNPSRGFICLPEIDLGLLIPSPLQLMFQRKLTPTAYRDAVLEGRRYSGEDALKGGLVDALGGLAEAIQLIHEKKLVGKGGPGTVWGGLKENAWREVWNSIENEDETSAWRKQIEMRKSESKEDGRRKVEDWELMAGKAKI